MRRFRFKLQSVLDHAERVEQVRQQALAEAKEQKKAAKARLEELKKLRAMARRELLSRPKAQVDLRELEELHRHVERLAEQIADQRAEVTRLEQVEAQRTEELLEAMQRKQMLEKLREKDAAAHQLHLNSLEARMLDDTVMPRHAMRQASLG